MFDEAGSASYGIDIKLKKVGDGWDDLSAGIGKFSSAVDGVVGKLARIGSLGMFAAGTAAVGALSYGVMNLNAQAEGAAISLGAIFNANGMASGVPAGIRMAGDTIAKMRVDAQKLPGEFEDLQNIFTMGATSAFRAGLSPDKWREMSANAMATGSIFQMPLDQVAREMTQLMEGHAGSHNVFGAKLGFTGDRAKGLNAMDEGARAAAVGKEMMKFSGSLDAFAHSWSGLSSTFIDNVKTFARTATGPLFGSLEDTLEKINKWWGDNQDQINRFAMTLGGGIRDAFEWGKKKVVEWYPIVENFVEVAYNRFKDFWVGIEPYVTSFAKSFKDALADPNGTLDKLKTILELYAAMKIGGAALGVGSALGGMASGAGGILSGVLKFGGAGGAAASAAAADAGMVGMGGMGMTAAAAPEAAGLTGLGASATVVGGVFLAAVAAWGVAVYEAADLSRELKEQDQANRLAIGKARGDEIAAMIRSGAAEDDIAERLAFMAQPIDAAQWAFNDVATSAALAAANLDLIGGVIAAGQKASDSIAEQANRDSGMANFMTVMGKSLPTLASDAAAAAKKAPKMKGGHGGTHVQKVEIVVTSNQNPSRIARAVETRFLKATTNRRQSPDVPNFSNFEEG